MNRPSSLAKLFSQPGTWTQRAYARTLNGDAVYPSNVDATQFCLAGALMFVYDNGDLTPGIGGRSSDYREAILRVSEKIRFSDLTAFNDVIRRTQDEIFALCKEVGV